MGQFVWNTAVSTNASRHAAGAQSGRDLESGDGIGGVRADHDDRHVRRLTCHTRGRECVRDAIEAEAEADARRGLATQQRDEAVVSTTPTERVLLTVAPRRIAS